MFKKAADGIAKKGKTKAKCYAKGGVTRADGVAKKGHTKGKEVKMCNGGMYKGKK